MAYRRLWPCLSFKHGLRSEGNSHSTPSFSRAQARRASRSISLRLWPCTGPSAVSAASACERTALRSAKQQGAIATQSNGVERSRSGDWGVGGRSPTSKAREGRMRISINRLPPSHGREGLEGDRPSSSLIFRSAAAVWYSAFILIAYCRSWNCAVAPKTG